MAVVLSSLCPYCVKAIDPSEDRMHYTNGTYHADCFADYLVTRPAGERAVSRFNANFERGRKNIRLQQSA